MEEIQAEFPILQRKRYLNTCSLGALSRRSSDAVSEFLRLWGELGASAWYEIWLGELHNLRASFARSRAGVHDHRLVRRRESVRVQPQGISLSRRCRAL